MKKIIVTGSSGFVGGVTASLASQDFEVTGTFFSQPFSIPGVQSVKLNILNSSDVKDLISTIKPDAIIHCAAWANLDACEENPLMAENVNVHAVENIAEAARNIGCKVVFTSSDMVYSGEAGNYRETDPAEPINFYGNTKKRAENILSDLLPDLSVSARVALVYGRPVTNAESFSEKIIISLKQGQEVRLFRDQFRTPVHVKDLAKSLIELAQNDFSGIINIGGSRRIDRYSFGLKLARILNLDKNLILSVLMKDASMQAPRPVDTSLDISLAGTVIKANPEDVDSGLEQAYGA